MRVLCVTESQLHTWGEHDAGNQLYSNINQEV